MTDKLKNIIKEEIVKLPKDTRAAIEAVDWASKVEEIGKKYLLNESETNDLQVETMLVMFGIDYADSYTTNIENKVGTTKDDAEKIAQEIYEKVFSPINDVFVENIRKSGKHINAAPEQNLDFILSGGDYSAFVEKRDNVPPSTSQGEGQGVRSESLNKIPKPPKMEDIRSKFTI